jgi:hypothetical protein
MAIAPIIKTILLLKLLHFFQLLWELKFFFVSNINIALSNFMVPKKLGILVALQIGYCEIFGSIATTIIFNKSLQLEFSK